ncbi:putative serine/threonine-protein kinase [Aspergillus foveolatus]|uniref:putative serine/threonine-protein kinase n=1 Tax=Aspergillus foveolatus TaxID=210207 RepID=UPI003CCCD446
MLSLWWLNLASRRTMFSFAIKSPWNIPPCMGPPLPQQELVDEEGCPGYDSAAFYPAQPGEVLAKRFKLLLKWQSEQAVTLKINNSNSGDVAQREKEIEYHIKQQNLAHRGRGILRTCLDDFKITGPGGKHMRLKRFVDRRLPLSIAKAYIYTLLSPNLPLRSQTMSFENENILTDFIERQPPMQYKVHNESGRTIYRCHNDFSALDSRGIKKMIPKLADFGLTTRLGKPSTRSGMLGEQLGIYPIQPDHYRAPEVILGCGWDFKVDIWNFGVLAFLELGWPRPVTNDTGKLCHNVQEFFGGPFFDTEALFSEQKNREIFSSFVRQMLTWPPEERKTARELIDHSFLEFGG